MTIMKHHINFLLRAQRSTEGGNRIKRAGFLFGPLLKFMIFILAMCFIHSLCSCTKGWEDISEMPPAKKVFIISKRFTSEWIYLKTVTAEIKGVDWQPYYNQKPDTLISTCSIDKIDSLFKIEIRSYDIK